MGVLEWFYGGIALREELIIPNQWRQAQTTSAYYDMDAIEDGRYAWEWGIWVEWRIQMGSGDMDGMEGIDRVWARYHIF